MTDLAKLVVRLEAESARLQKDLDGANRQLQRFEKTTKSATDRLKQIGKIGGVALAAVGAGMLALTRQTLNLADRIGKLSQTTGLSSETLSRLRYQAELSGVSFEATAKGVGRMQRAMFDAEQGLKTQSDAFKRVGVAVTDSNGKLRNTEEVMLDVAERFSQMEDGAEKAALAQVIFGRAGADMIPMLNLGRDGLKEMGEEADRLGITMDGKLTDAAQKINDNMTRLRTALYGVFVRLIAQALPQIQKITERLVAWSQESANLERVTTAINVVMKILQHVMIGLSTAFNVVGKQIGAAAASLGMLFTGNFRGAAQVWKDANIDSLEQVKSGIDSVVGVWTGTADTIDKSAEQTAKKIASPLTKVTDQVNQEVNNIGSEIGRMEKMLQSAAKQSESLSKKFNDRFKSVTQPKFDSGGTTFLDIGSLQIRAEEALKKGDIDAASTSLMRAYDVLENMRDAGTLSSLVIEGVADRLKKVGDQIAQQPLADIEAKVSVDLQGALDAARQGNEAMQRLLDENPLTQKVLIDNDMLPNAATQRADGMKNMKQANIQIPGGRERVFYGDERDVDDWQRELNREALKRGKR